MSTTIMQSFTFIIYSEKITMLKFMPHKDSGQPYADLFSCESTRTKHTSCSHILLSHYRLLSISRFSISPTFSFAYMNSVIYNFALPDLLFPLTSIQAAGSEYRKEMSVLCVRNYTSSSFGWNEKEGRKEKEISKWQNHLCVDNLK